MVWAPATVALKLLGFEILIPITNGNLFKNATLLFGVYLLLRMPFPVDFQVVSYLKV
jgi:hypothetical protein